MCRMILFFRLTLENPGVVACQYLKTFPHSLFGWKSSIPSPFSTFSGCRFFCSCVSLYWRKLRLWTTSFIYKWPTYFRIDNVSACSSRDSRLHPRCNPCARLTDSRRPHISPVRTMIRSATKTIPFDRHLVAAHCYFNGTSTSRLPFKLLFSCIPVPCFGRHFIHW
ncbi:hypothetical protein FPQ18DRAFT_350227 [Pyronema domesticum]|nr:hypothetical protein FPQ18DRAFT_350227 [Pyronema domesticum]